MTRSVDSDRRAVIASALAGKRGSAFWRSLEELAGRPDVLGLLEAEFPGVAVIAASPISRRRVLQVMAASFALAGLTGCGSDAAEEAVPYVMVPPGIIPGRPRTYATALTRAGYAQGVLVTHQMGRPIKVEGNPEHPASLGATDVIGQASILDLYDPDRSQASLHKGEISDSDSLIRALLERLGDLRARGGDGLRLLTGCVSSPTLALQIDGLQRRFPGLRWHRWDAEARDSERAGCRLAFGRMVDPVLHVEGADVLLAIESDLLDAAPGHLSYARAFARRRRAPEEAAPAAMSRLYAIESTPTLTGARADHRFIVRPDAIEPALRALAAELGAGPATWKAASPSWVAAVARDLERHRGAALLHAGAAQPAEVHALTHAINATLGAPGKTVSYIDPVEHDPVDHAASVAELVADMAAGKVDTLVIIGTNPVFTAPADLGFADALQRVALSVHLGTHVDETAARCTWHVPEAHEFERWSDARAFDGTASVVQPQLKPLWSGWSPHQLLAVLGGDPNADGYEIVRSYWTDHAKTARAADPDAFWTDAVRAGVVPDTRAEPVQVAVAADLSQHLDTNPSPSKARGLSVLFRPDPWLRDGRYANNGWLQELPRPLTTLTWDNAVLIAPETAKRLKVESQDLVDLRTSTGTTVRAPVWVLPGQAPDCLTVPFGFGRQIAGRVGKGVGFDAFRLRARNSLWARHDIELHRTGKTVRLAATQHHQMIDGDDVVRSMTVEQFEGHLIAHAEPEPKTSLYPDWSYDRNAWAMAINLNSCIGCHACTAACQAENNIAVVGKDQVLRNRQMHWIRVDRWFSGTPEAPEEILFQPMPCMHCEHAPCEVVCPVAATVHDTDGLNVMVYNRCVGTRFCSNNCPYKVRRFNYLEYAHDDPRLSLSWNPDVTVRARGVMEKCTYCLQRIREARITAEREGRSIRDGDVTTACQQVCPAEAIVFGDRNDPTSAVNRRKASPLDYGVLTELNTRPRTTYQARLRNPNPEIEEG